jgi:hypothetical protein
MLKGFGKMGARHPAGTRRMPSAHFSDNFDDEQ